MAIKAAKRYLVANRHGTGLPSALLQHVENTVRSDQHGQTIRKTRSGRHVIKLSEQTAHTLAQQAPDLIVEEDKPIQLAAMPGLPPIVSQAPGITLPIEVRNAKGQPVADCTVYAVGQGIGYNADTDNEGKVTLTVGSTEIERIIISPRDTYWSAIFNNIDTDNFTELDAKLQAFDVGQVAVWRHRLMGFDQAAPSLTGLGVSVAVIDSGIASAATSIHPAGGINTLDGSDPASWNIDEKGHGTHCAGIIAAQPAVGESIHGGAPGVALYSVKVFPGGYVSDLVEGIEWCIANNIDLVNMSLGNPEPSEVLAAAIAEAFASGITIVAATGNQNTHVAFPAALPDVIGVGAIGRTDSFPKTSAHALKVGNYRDWWGGLFNANFSNFGSKVFVCAPGVAIASTVPTGYATWDGTSMACPSVTALAALVLEANPWLRTRDIRQAQALRWILATAAVDMGLPPEIQGHGLPTVPRALAAAQQFTKRS